MSHPGCPHSAAVLQGRKGPKATHRVERPTTPSSPFSSHRDCSLRNRIFRGGGDGTARCVGFLEIRARAPVPLRVPQTAGLDTRRSRGGGKGTPRTQSGDDNDVGRPTTASVSRAPESRFWLGHRRRPPRNKYTRFAIREKQRQGNEKAIYNPPGKKTAVAIKSDNLHTHIHSLTHSKPRDRPEPTLFESSPRPQGSTPIGGRHLPLTHLDPTGHSVKAHGSGPMTTGTHCPLMQKVPGGHSSR